MTVVGGEHYFDLPPGDELASRNRQLIAECLDWPEGALEACEAIERARPDWSPNWRAANTCRGFESPAGYYALRRGRRGDERPAYGATPRALLEAIRLVVSACPRCGRRYPIPAGGDLPLHEVPGTARRCDVHWSLRTVEAGPVQFGAPQVDERPA